MDTMLASRLLAEPIQGKTVFMVHLHDERQYWQSLFGQRIPIETSHSLGFQATRRAFRVPTIGVNELKVAYLLDELVPDEPKTNDQRSLNLELLKHLPNRPNKAADDSHAEWPQAPYRSVVITLATLAKKEACHPDDRQAIADVLDKFAPWYTLFRFMLPTLNREKVIALVEHVLRRSLPTDKTLVDYDFADQIWLPAIFEEAQLKPIDNLLIDTKPGFYRAEDIMVARWARTGTRVIAVEADRPVASCTAKDS